MSTETEIHPHEWVIEQLAPGTGNPWHVAELSVEGESEAAGISIIANPEEAMFHITVASADPRGGKRSVACTSLNPGDLARLLRRALFLVEDSTNSSTRK